MKTVETKIVLDPNDFAPYKEIILRFPLEAIDDAKWSSLLSGGIIDMQDAIKGVVELIRRQFQMEIDKQIDAILKDHVTEK